MLIKKCTVAEDSFVIILNLRNRLIIHANIIFHEDNFNFKYNQSSVI